MVTPPTRLDKSSLAKRMPPKRCKSSFRLKLMIRMLRRNSKVLEKISRMETLLSWTQLPVLQLILPKPLLILSIRLILMLLFNLKPWRLQLILRLMICILMPLLPRMVISIPRYKSALIESLPLSPLKLKNLQPRRPMQPNRLACKLKNRCASRRRSKDRKNGKRRSARLRSSRGRSRNDLSEKNR